MFSKVNNRQAKLFCGLIGHSFEKVIKRLIKCFGSIEVRNGVIQFDYTNYYNEEMGNNLLRDWVAFDNLIKEEDIGKIKVLTCNIEKEFLQNGRRTVNIDPGYVNLSRVILASTKDFSHRIYIGGGIFAEITLIYKHNQFITLPWTYPDYRDNVEYFERIRNILYNQVIGDRL